MAVLGSADFTMSQAGWRFRKERPKVPLDSAPQKIHVLDMDGFIETIRLTHGLRLAPQYTSQGQA